MALPNVGNSISLNQVNVELGLSGTTTISMNQSTVRTLFQVASGQISMYAGFGKSAAAPLAWVSQPGSTLTYCEAGGYTEGASLNWYFTAPAGTTVYYTIYQLYNGNNGCLDTQASVYTSGNFTATNGTNSLGQGVYGGQFWRLKLVNGGNTIESNWVKVVGNLCYLNEYCAYYQGGPDNGSWGCHNCSEVCSCDPCTYDCNCDCATGYGTGGCDCGSNCDWCNWYYRYTCEFSCHDCCPWDDCSNGTPYQCNCYEDCYWEGPNPNWPCPCGQQTCSTNCYCPCGETCGYGDRYSDVQNYGQWSAPIGNC